MRRTPSTPVSRAVRRLPLLALAPLLAACAQPSSDGTPEGTVRLWLDRMEQSVTDPRAVKDAVALLGPGAVANLEERARRTALFTGRRVEAYEMVAPGRFGLRFRPRRFRASIVEARATVEVTGEDPAHERATLRCVRVPSPHGQVWRVEPELPELTPLPRRDG